MQRVLLIFPDISAMADFVLEQQVKDAEVNSLEKALVATLPKKQIDEAQKIYGAFLKSIIPKN